MNPLCRPSRGQPVNPPERGWTRRRFARHAATAMPYLAGAVASLIMTCASCASLKGGAHGRTLSPQIPIASPTGADEQTAGKDASAVGKGLLLQGADSIIGMIAVTALGVAVLAPLIGSWMGARRYERVHRPRRLAAELEWLRRAGGKQ